MAVSNQKSHLLNNETGEEWGIRTCNKNWVYLAPDLREGTDPGNLCLKDVLKDGRGLGFEGG